MNCYKEECYYFDKLMDANCSCGDDTEWAERCLENNYCYFRPADLPEAGATAERISSVVRSNATTGWIKVSERLPDTDSWDIPCMIRFTDGYETRSDYGTVHDTYRRLQDGHITHWRDI